MENMLYERVMAQIIRKTKKWNDLGKMMERRKEDTFDLNTLKNFSREHWCEKNYFRFAMNPRG